MNEQDLNRRAFVGLATLLGISAAGLASQPQADQPKPEPTPAPGADDFPRQPMDMVRAVVGAAHTDLERVKELVEACPPLARASWDWGFGDWESALGAASHTGQRAIADYLMQRGARPDIFTFAMLGNLDAVRAMVNAHPGIQRTPGPHGITLLRHAVAGGPPAADVRKYLESLGDADKEPENFPLTPEQIETFVGTYALEGVDDVTFVIKNVKGRLAFQRGNQPHRMLSNHTAYQFSPAGAPEVRLQFEFVDGRAASVTGRNHTASFKAIRSGG